LSQNSFDLKTLTAIIINKKKLNKSKVPIILSGVDQKLWRGSALTNPEIKEMDRKSKNHFKMECFAGRYSLFFKISNT